MPNRRGLTTSVLPTTAFCSCVAPLVVGCASLGDVWIEFSTEIAQTSATRFCLTCSSILTTNNMVGVPDPGVGIALRAREAIGKSGDATTLDLPAWADIGIKIAPKRLYQTTTSDRFERNVSLMPAEDRCGALRTALKLPRNFFPRSITTVVESLPNLLLHEGLAWKLADPPDSNHFRLSSQTSRSVRSPYEVWADVDDKGKRIVRFLNRYGAPVAGTASIVNHLVVMEADTGIALTQYIRRDLQVTADRKGTLLFAAYAAVPE